MTSRLPAVEPAGRELDDEGRRLREAVVLPVRSAPARPADASVRNVGDARVAARRAHARTPGANERLRLVVPDRDVGPDAQDEPSSEARLPLGEGAGSRVLRVPSASEAAPLGPEVPVQVDAAGVLAKAGGGAVRVHLVDDPERDPAGSRCADEPARDRLSGALVAVDAADDEDPPSRVRVADDDRSNGAVVPRPAEELDDGTPESAADHGRERERKSGEDAHRFLLRDGALPRSTDSARRSMRRATG